MSTRKANPSPTTGIRLRHSRSCGSRQGASCSCSPSFEAWVWAKTNETKVRRTFKTKAEAKRWRTDLLKQAQEGTLRKPSSLTVSKAADEWVRLAQEGNIRNRSGDRYKPSTLRGIRQSFTLRIVPALGTYRLNEVSKGDVQRLTGKWTTEGHSPSSVRNTVNALRALYRDADMLTADAVTTNPTVGLRLAAVRGKRDRIAEPEEADRLIAALPKVHDRALWAVAFYAGLRHGEVKALRWEAVDLSAGVIRVVESWDQIHGPVAPKSMSGTREVPIIGLLRPFLVEWGLESRRSTGLVFSRNGESPFSSSAANKACDRCLGDGQAKPHRTP